MPASSVTPGESTRLLGHVTGFVAGMGVRRGSNAWVGGVCAGIARRLDLDPAVVRVAVVMLTMLTGAMGVLYGLSWFVLPAPAGPSRLERVSARIGSLGALVLLVAMAVLLAVTMLGSTSGSSGFGWGGPGYVVILAGIGGCVWMALRQGTGGATLPAADAAPIPPAQAPAQASAQAPVPATGLGAATGLADPADPAGPAGPAGLAAAPAEHITPSPEHIAPSPEHTSGATATAASPRRRPRLPPWAALVMAGVALAVSALTRKAHEAAGWPGDGQVMGLATAAIVVALVLIVAGACGRRGGFTSLLGIVLAIAVGVTAFTSSDAFTGGTGQRSWSVSVPGTTSAQPLQLGAGTATLTINRSAATPPAGGPGAPPRGPSAATPRVHARVGLGELIVRIPDGLTVDVVAYTRIGEILIDGDARPGSDIKDVTVRHTFGEGEPQLIVHAEVTYGSLRIERTER